MGKEKERDAFYLLCVSTTTRKMMMMMIVGPPVRGQARPSSRAVDERERDGSQLIIVIVVARSQHCHRLYCTVHE